VTLFGPESYCRGSGSFVLQGGGGSQKMAVALLGVHIPSKNSTQFTDISIPRLFVYR
jgi:hypothetical protein